MAKKIEEQLYSIVRRKNQVTDLESLVQGYRLMFTFANKMTCPEKSVQFKC